MLLALLAVVALIGVFLLPQWLTSNTAGAGDDRQPAAAGVHRSAPPIARTSASDPSPNSEAATTAAGAAAPTATVALAAGTASGCALPGGVLRVVAAPELAAVVSAAVGTGPRATFGSITSGPCRVAVTALDPASFISTWQTHPANRPQVWIPDSSIWLSRAAVAGIPVAASTPSLATSPAVLAISVTAAARLSGSGVPTLEQVLDSRTTTTPIRVGLPDPRASIPAVENLVAVQGYAATGPAARSALTWAVGSGPEHLPSKGSALLSRLRTDPFTAVPVSEQAVVANNNSRAGWRAVAVYNRATGVGLDYPFTAVGSNPVAGQQIGVLQVTLQSSPIQRQVAAAGFRDAAGHRGAGDTSGAGREWQPSGAVPSVAAVDKVLHDVAVLRQPSRLLAAIDVSGSMGSPVPAAGGATRLDLARSAATLGLALYPSDSEVGIWIFSRNLTATTDYRELVAVGPLTAVSNGRSGAKRVGEAIAGAQVDPDGATGLYDTTLAAVRGMRAQWDPARVNAVLILSDGQNDDQGGLSLSALLSTLQREQDRSRPVPVITIGLGPDSDVDALSQISRTTGGAAYVARDPRDIGQIFLDAVGQRLCRPHC